MKKSPEALAIERFLDYTAVRWASHRMAPDRVPGMDHWTTPLVSCYSTQTTADMAEKFRTEVREGMNKYWMYIVLPEVFSEEDT